MRLERYALSEQLRQFIDGGDGVLVGAPGVGKTYILKAYCRELLAKNIPCLYLPIDRLGVNSELELRTELGISTDLATYLRSLEKPSMHPPVLAIDAYDAARSEFAQQFVLGIIRRVREACDGQWRIIVSVRSYDAKKSTALQNLFPTNELAAPPTEFRDSEISCRHFFVRPLTTDEVVTVVQTIPKLAVVYLRSSAEFQNLLKTPFNLWLVETFLSQTSSISEISGVNSEIQLLNLFWKQRVLQTPNSIDLQVLLTRVATEMVARKTMAVRIADVCSIGAGNLLDYLLSSEVLDENGPLRQRVSFTHNILFDYAVSVLLMEDEPSAACAFLMDDLSRPLFLRPSIDYYFTRLWHLKPPIFWDVLWYMLRAPETHVRVYARLVPAAVMAREARRSVEFTPLVERLAIKDKVGARALLHLLQAVRGLFVGQRDELWANLVERASSFLQGEFAWNLAALTLDILDRALKVDDKAVISKCSKTGRQILAWAWSERSEKINSFLDNLGASWGVRLVARTFATDPSANRAMLLPILERLHDPKYSIEYFSRLTDELNHIWPTDPKFAIDVYEAGFAHEERSEEVTMFGTAILPLTSTRRQDFSMCQYHLIEHYKNFLIMNPLAAARAVFRALNAFVMGRHIIPFLNPGFTKKDVTELFPFREHKAVYIRDLSYAWEASTHSDEPIKMADELFAYIEELAQSGDLAVVDALLDVFAEEARVAFFWKRLLDTGGRVPSVFASRLFDLIIAKPILEGAETLQAVGNFMEQAAREWSETQRHEVETQILKLATVVTSDKDTEKRDRWRDRLLSRLPRDLLTVEQSKLIREELERKNAVPNNHPLVKMSIGWQAISEDERLKEEGAELERPANRALLETTVLLDKFSSDWQNERPTGEAISKILPELERALRTVREGDAADTPVRDLTWTRVASAAEVVARGVSDINSDAFRLAKEILLIAPTVDPARGAVESDESYTSPHWSPSPTTEAAQGLPWLARLNADDDLLATIESLARDPRPSVRYLTMRESFRIIKTSPETFWRLADERAVHERNVVVLDALCQALGDLLPSEEDRVASILEIIAKRVLVTNGDSDTLRNLTAIAMWLALVRENGWALGFSNKLLERPVEFSQALSYAAFQAVNWITPSNIATERDPVVVRSIAWLSGAIAAAERGIRSTRTKIGETPEEASMQLLKRLYGVLHETVMRLHFAFDPNYVAAREGGKEITTEQRFEFYRRVKPLLVQIVALAADPKEGLLFAPTAHHFMEFLQKAVSYDPRGALHLAADVASAAERSGYHLDAMAAEESVRLAEHILADHRSELRDPEVLSDLLRLLDLFARVGWPDALKLLWRLDEIFR